MMNTLDKGTCRANVLIAIRNNMTSLCCNCVNTAIGSFVLAVTGAVMNTCLQAL